MADEFDPNDPEFLKFKAEYDLYNDPEFEKFKAEYDSVNKQKSPMTPGRAFAGGMIDLGQKASFGAMDEIVAGGNAAIDAITGGPGYSARLKEAQGLANDYRDYLGNTEGLEAANVASKMAYFLPGGVKQFGAKAGLAGKEAIKQGAKYAAAQGATEGFLSGEGLEGRLTGAATGGAVGGLVGAAAPAAVEGIKGIGSLIKRGGEYVNKGLQPVKKILSPGYSTLPEPAVEQIVADAAALPDKFAKTLYSATTEADRAKSLAVAPPVVDEATGTVVSQLDNSLQRIDADLGLSNAPVSQVLPKVLKREKELLKLAKDATARWDMENPGGVQGVEFPKAWKYVEKFQANSPEEEKALELITKEIDSFTEGWDGSLTQLVEKRKQLDAMNSSLYNRDNLTTSETIRAEVTKKFTSDLRDAIKNASPEVKEISEKLHDVYNTMPIAQRVNASWTKFQTDRMAMGQSPQVIREGKPAVPAQTFPEKSEMVPGPLVQDAARLSGTVGGRMGAGMLAGALAQAAGAPWWVGAPLAIGAGDIGRTVARRVIDPQKLATFSRGVGAVGGAMERGANAVPPNMTPLISSGLPREVFGPAFGVESAEAQTRLPRDTDALSQEALSNLLMSTVERTEGNALRPLVGKAIEAQRRGDISTLEKLHADMARIAPDLFEDGVGVNGKLFHPDDKKRALEDLEMLHRLGEVDSITLAKQRNAFANPADGRILNITPKSRQSTQQGNRMVGGTRVYPY